MTDTKTPDPRLVAALDRAGDATVLVAHANPRANFAGWVSHLSHERVRLRRPDSAAVADLALSGLHLVQEGPGWLVVSLGEPAAEGVCKTCDGEGGRDIAVADERAPGVYSFPCPDCAPAPGQPERPAAPQRPELPPGYSVEEHSDAFVASFSADSYGQLRVSDTRGPAVALAWSHFRLAHPEWTAYLDAVALPTTMALAEAIAHARRSAPPVGDEFVEPLAEISTEPSKPDEPEPPPLPEGCTWDGSHLTGASEAVWVEPDGTIAVRHDGMATVWATSERVRYVLWQHDRAARAAGGGQ